MSYAIIYSIMINKDTNNDDLLSVVALAGANDAVSNISGKRVRTWNRFFNGKDLDEIKDHMESYPSWKETVYQNNCKVTNDNMFNRIKKTTLEENVFYSDLYLFPAYAKDHIAANALISKLVEEYNSKKILYTVKQLIEIREAMRPEIVREFGDKKSKEICKHIWHSLRTTRNKFKTMEVL